MDITPRKFRKKPVVVEAMQFETNNEAGDICMNRITGWVNQGKNKCGAWHNGTEIYISTLEGEMKAEVKDWIIRGIKGEFYPCKADIFEKTYEAC